MERALVLTLHGVSADLLPPEVRDTPSVRRYTLPPETLAWLLDHVRRGDCCTAADLGQATGGRRVVLTFDDGFRSDFSLVLPALLSRGLTATFFVTADHVGRDGYVTWDQLAVMRSSGMEIGSHGLTHRNLLTLGREDARREIRTSKEVLEERLGAPVVSFAPVGGHHRRWIVEEAWAAGYRTFSSMVPGWSTVRPGTVFLHRNFVQDHHRTRHLERLLRGDRLTLWGSRARYEMLGAVRRVLGLQRYRDARSLLLRRSGS